MVRKIYDMHHSGKYPAVEELQYGPYVEGKPTYTAESSEKLTEIYQELGIDVRTEDNEMTITPESPYTMHSNRMRNITKGINRLRGAMDKLKGLADKVMGKNKDTGKEDR